MGGAAILDCHTRISVLTEPFVIEIFIGAQSGVLTSQVRDERSINQTSLSTGPETEYSDPSLLPLTNPLEDNPLIRWSMSCSKYWGVLCRMVVYSPVWAVRERRWERAPVPSWPQRDQHSTWSPGGGNLKPGSLLIIYYIILRYLSHGIVQTNLSAFENNFSEFNHIKKVHYSFSCYSFTIMENKETLNWHFLYTEHSIFFLDIIKGLKKPDWSRGNGCHWLIPWQDQLWSFTTAHTMFTENVFFF